jgi:hypothetical protein
MGLPVQKAPEYFCVLPLSEKEVKFRPFLVKEQRNLLLLQDGETKETYNILKTLINDVTMKKIDIDDLPVADLEYLFLQIRCKSVGETTDLLIPCKDTECIGKTPLTVNLNEIKIDTSNLPEKRIELSDELGIILEFPKASIQKSITSDNDTQNFMEIIKSSVVQIYDDENVYDLVDYSDTEKDEFFESLTVTQIEKIADFLNNVPSLSHSIETVCPICSKDQVIELKGLENFF